MNPPDRANDPIRKGPGVEHDRPFPVGASPIPEGHVRLYHYTWDSNLPSIREHGLLESHARGDGGKGAGNEPSAGVWASTGRPAYTTTQKRSDNDMKPDIHGDRALVEFHAHPDEISGRAEYHYNNNVQEWAKGYHHVIMNGNVNPQQIVGIHRNWHHAADYILSQGHRDLDSMRETIKHGDDQTFGPYKKADDYLFNYKNERDPNR